MYYILYDNIDGTILGVDFLEHTEGNWQTTNKETYEFILDNNGAYIINIDKLNEKLKSYNVEEPLITKDLLISNKNNDLYYSIETTISKNNYYCKAYIRDGINFRLDNGEIKKYTYTEIDQLNFNETLLLISNDMIENIPIKFKGEEEYTIISIDEFKRLYKELLKNKYFQLFYLRAYNNYLRTVTDLNKLRRMSYETSLPLDLRKQVDDKVKKLFKEEE